MEISLGHYIFLGSVLFIIGMMGFMIRRNIITVFMSLELMFNAIGINLVGFSNHFGIVRGQIFTMFIIAVAAAEAALGLAIIIVIYRNKPTVNVDEFNIMKW
jgi:NADH:ubiquinone oxidoreductase subunit K